MRILTFDVEEWFHLLDNDSTKSEAQWNNYEERIHKNMDRVFQILDDTNTKATFFVIGWIAKKYPEIVKRIAEKYEIGSHTYNHQLVWQQSPKEFADDIAQSKALLEDITGKPVKYFRAPGFSIRETESWAFEAIAKTGFEYDCSVFPAHHAHGGISSYGKVYPSIISHNGFSVKEFPISVVNVLNRNIIYSGGGYFRLFPYCLIKRWTEQSSDYVLSYIHPRDLDSGQPMIKDLPLSRKFKSYVGLNGAESKLRKWLTDFKFTDIQTAASTIDWSVVAHLRF